MDVVDQHANGLADQGAVRGARRSPVNDQADGPVISVGGQWVVDAAGCEVAALQSLPLIQSICGEVIESLGLKVIGQPQSHVFGSPHGVTALYLLSESHLAVHTYPEHGIATFNLVCCREQADWDWRRQLTQRLRANHVDVRHLRRGAWNDAALCLANDSANSNGRESEVDE
ncbi:S-adenosylmethionine decarboxylase [Rhodopirellula sp. JC740]|uniref:S-adenosylmethionine decarboxylase n=1 Tax=Rhodopirellula halodulae TaxID=2894198 RepID=A0ABS8NMY2_9BACT|nr:S-adenosylmethionine decarboxylase [Rhodopirellula sp. JC740]MCC9644928.1 S-adenosylmethionine decarboxylase [Rhodopirellula sp. JC740]